MNAERDSRWHELQILRAMCAAERAGGRPHWTSIERHLGLDADTVDRIIETLKRRELVAGITDRRTGRLFLHPTPKGFDVADAADGQLQPGLRHSPISSSSHSARPMEHKQLLDLADRVLVALYQLDDDYSRPAIVDAVREDPHSLARVFRYLVKQGLVETLAAFGSDLPVQASLTALGLRRAEELLRLRAKPEAAPTSVTYHLYGDNSRVNNHSTDASSNVVVSGSAELFAELRTALERLEDGEQRSAATQHLEALQSAPPGPTRGAAFTGLLSVGANAMTVLQPFLPALVQWVQSVR